MYLSVARSRSPHSAVSPFSCGAACKPDDHANQGVLCSEASDSSSRRPQAAGRAFELHYRTGQYLRPNFCLAQNSTAPKWLWVKKRFPKWNPGKWKHGLKPAVSWWFNFDPYPKVRRPGGGFLPSSSSRNCPPRSPGSDLERRAESGDNNKKSSSDRFPLKPTGENKTIFSTKCC